MPQVQIPEEQCLVSSVYQPWPKQAVFHGSGAKFRLFGGAQGPGKSLALLWEAILHCLQYAGSNALLLRRTCPELDSTLIDHFQKHVLGKVPDTPAWRGIFGGRKAFNQTARLHRFPNGSVLRFGYCERFSHVYNYDGAEYVFIGFDELTQFPFRIWEHLRLRNRCPVPGSRPCMAGATNPGGENSEWVKALWIDRKPFPGMEAYQYDPTDYDFIPASVWDNPVYANDAEYIKNLQQMSPALRAQRLEGRWDKFEGQFFSNFDPMRHVWDTRNNPFLIPAWWPRWIGIDWGFAHHTAIRWHTHGKIRLNDEQEPRQVVLTYRERDVREQTADELGELIAKMSGGDTINAIYLSPDAFARRDSHRTIAHQLTAALLKHGLPACTMADNDRVGGWNLMYQMLELDEWMIWDTCPQTIASLPTLMRDPEKLEDVKKTESLADDVGDALRYGLKSHLRPRTMPAEDVYREKLETIQDPVAKMFFAYKHMQEKKAEGPIKPVILPRWAIKQ
jgi:phage terminase large subunit